MAILQTLKRSKRSPLSGMCLCALNGFDDRLIVVKILPFKRDIRRYAALHQITAHDDALAVCGRLQHQMRTADVDRHAVGKHERKHRTGAAARLLSNDGCYAHILGDRRKEVSRAERQRRCEYIPVIHIVSVLSRRPNRQDNSLRRSFL